MPLTIHHLGASTSERLLWLCEELCIPYTLIPHRRSSRTLLAPRELRSLHPQGTAPVIQDGDVVLAETAACVEYIAQKHGGGRLFLSPSHARYADFVYWFHWANGTLMPNISRVMVLQMAGIRDAKHPMVKFAQDRLDKSLKALDDRLTAGNTWLAGGEEFTAADVMMVFPLTTGRYFTPFSLAKYPNILAYLKRVGEREAYRRAMSKGDPGLELELALGAEPPKRDLSKL
ncbi:glutathione S-transferase [Aspergillus pseudoustus]|uniref:Glutathione S-transferase n=1 Tax=Aspergillus pseudoustus TaxID=1810923 RepID=A0ABR4KVY2_9EURO